VVSGESLDMGKCVEWWAIQICSMQKVK
jgi:hypothetical protein